MAEEMQLHVDLQAERDRAARVDPVIALRAEGHA